MPEQVVREQRMLAIAGNQNIRRNPKEENGDSDADARQPVFGPDGNLRRPTRNTDSGENEHAERGFPGGREGQPREDRQKEEKDRKRRYVSGGRMLVEQFPQRRIDRPAALNQSGSQNSGSYFADPAQRFSLPSPLRLSRPDGRLASAKPSPGGNGRSDSADYPARPA